LRTIIIINLFLKNIDHSNFDIDQISSITIFQNIICVDTVEKDSLQETPKKRKKYLKSMGAFGKLKNCNKRSDQE